MDFVTPVSCCICYLMYILNDGYGFAPISGGGSAFPGSNDRVENNTNLEAIRIIKEYHVSCQSFQLLILIFVVPLPHYH